MKGFWKRDYGGANQHALGAGVLAAYGTPAAGALKFILLKVP
jgi:hypothetical protein